mmetsp:Transcript_35810/g.86443  ORF Transcript_35810/g.86443 Transcript_35810/m.86443 type:complete len:214 (+) Transcript_35810:209-850(+)
MIGTIRSSKEIMSWPSSKQHHICRLAVDYIKHHYASLDENYFHALTSELYLPDDMKHAVDVAADLFGIMKATGWEAALRVTHLAHRDGDGYVERGDFVPDFKILLRYLTETERTQIEIDEITAKVPERVLHVLLREVTAKVPERVLRVLLREALMKNLPMHNQAWQIHWKNYRCQSNQQVLSIAFVILFAGKEPSWCLIDSSVLNLLVLLQWE